MKFEYITNASVYAFICLCCESSVWAQENVRSAWRPEVGLEYTAEIQLSNAGKRNFANLLRLNADLPISSFLTAEIASLSAYMTSRESIGEDLQTYSNLDADKIPFALSVCGMSLEFSECQSLFLGIRNMNEDYFTSDATSFFTNSSCGVYPTISANYPIANYPVASVGIHYGYIAESWGIQLSVYNGVGYSNFAGHENVFRFSPKDDGVFVVAEAQFHRGGSSYFAGNAMRIADGVGASPWIYAEQAICDKLTLLAGYSHAFAEDVECRDFAGAGLLFGFGKSELGFFTDYADFRDAVEWATELSYKYSFNEHICLQPAVHAIQTGSSWSGACCLRFGLIL